MKNKTPLDRIKEYNGRFLGLTELAAIYDITIQHCFIKKKRGHLPKPIENLAMGSIWSKKQIIRELEKNS
jgi:hypothetical protein